MMGKIPVVVNFDTGTYFGEAAFTYIRDETQTLTDTWVYEGIISEEGVLLGTWTITVCGWANKEVGCTGGVPRPGVGIITEDGRGLYLYDLLDTDTEMLQLYETGRNAIVSARAKYMNNPEYPPNCRR